MRMTKTDENNLIDILYDYVDWYHSVKHCEALTYPSSTPEARLMETGVAHKKESDSWMSNKETRTPEVKTPEYFVHHRLTDMDIAIKELGKRMHKFVLLQHNRDEKITQDQLAKAVYVSRTKLWRIKSQWYSEIFNKLRRKRVI